MSSSRFIPSARGRPASKQTLPPGVSPYALPSTITSGVQVDLSKENRGVQNQVMRAALHHRISELRWDGCRNDLRGLTIVIAFVVLGSTVLRPGGGTAVRHAANIWAGRSLMFTVVSMALYASILWVLGVVVIRERRRSRYLDRTQTIRLPYSMSQYGRT